MRSFASLLILGAATISPACGPNGNGDRDGGGGGGSGDGGGGGGDEFADAMTCGAQQQDIGIVNLGPPPDLLIVLDRSGSMILPATLFPPSASKWDIMKMALRSVTEQFEQNIKFGLLLFPTDNDCAVTPGARVPIGLGQSSAIMGAVAGGPDGNTPSHLALAEALAVYQSIPVNTAGQYVLFATDSQPNCGGAPPNGDTDSGPETIAAVEALADAGVKTFVLGFGDIFVSNPQVLNDAALAGGVPRAGGPPFFYYATNQAELEQTFLDIAGGIIVPTCSFALTEQPPDPELVTVTINGAAVPRDRGHADGWDYAPDASTITFYGSYCASIEGGASSSVNFTYGCPGPEVE